MKVPREARYTNAPAIVEARLKPVGAGRVSDAQYRTALRQITESGRVPAGWQLEGVRWGSFTVQGMETDSFRFKRWREGQAIDLQAFPPALFTNAVVGIERLESERTVERTRTVTRTVEEWTGKYRSTRTGRYVKPAYAKRYRHLVEKEMVTRRVRRKVTVRERVPVEEAVIRFTYEATFTVADVPEVGEE